MLNAADEVFKRRIVFVDDRRALKRAVVYQDIDAVTACQRGIGHDRRGKRSGFLRFMELEELFGVFGHVFSDFLQIRQHGRMILVSRRQFIHEVPDRERRDFVIQLADFLARLLFPPRDVTQDFLNLALKFLDVFLNPFAFVGIQLFEFFGRQNLVVLHGGKGDAHRRLQHRHLALPCPLLQIVKLLGGPAAEFVLDGVKPGLVLLRLKSSG